MGLTNLLLFGIYAQLAHLTMGGLIGDFIWSVIFFVIFSMIFYVISRPFVAYFAWRKRTWKQRYDKAIARQARSEAKIEAKIQDREDRLLASIIHYQRMGWKLNAHQKRCAPPPPPTPMPDDGQHWGNGRREPVFRADNPKAQPPIVKPAAPAFTP